MAQTYDKVAVWIDGALIAENVSIEIALKTDDQDVFTLTSYGQQTNKRKIEVNLDNAVPTDGESFNSWRAALFGSVHRLRLQQLGTLQTLETEGFVREPNISSGEQKTSSKKFMMHCDAADWT